MNSDENKSNKVAFCPYCKTVLKKVRFVENRKYFTNEYRQSHISIKEDDTIYGDWESDFPDGDYDDEDPAVYCSECNREITDIVEETIDDCLYYEAEDAKEQIQEFLRKGNVNREEAMVEVL